MEQITIFSRIKDAGGVAEILSKYPQCRITGEGENWESALVEFGSGDETLSFAIANDPDYYSEPNWSVQMKGMHTYLSRFPESAARARALLLPSTFTFSLGAVLEPELEDANDPRRAILHEITTLLDGVMFTGSSLLDSEGRVLFSRDAEEEDPSARWPKVIASVPLAGTDEDSLYFGPDQDGDVDPPSPDRVARRAMALATLTARALMEEDADEPDAQETYRDLLEWAAAIGIMDEFEDIELAILGTPLGQLGPEAHINATWRLEGLVVLAWALDLQEIPPADELVQANHLWRSLGLLNIEEASEIIAAPMLRDRDQLLVQREKLFAIHWRLVDFQINPHALDFVDVARTCSFGPLDIEGVRLVKGDLALGDHCLANAAEAEFYSARSAAQERHQAANWLCDGPAMYSMASVDT
jgi:hypothetical protein